MIKRTGKSNQEHMNDLKKQVMKAMEEVGTQLEAEVKMVTPVDTGTLRRSITSKTTDEGDKIVTEVGSYGVNISAPYYGDIV